MAALLSLTAGCGSSGSTPPPKLSGNTSVTVLLSSTANDQLSQFNLNFQSLTLTSQSGNTVNLLSAQLPAELIHLNGGIAPLTNVTVPQDVYTSATAVLGGTSFTCVTLMGQGSSSPGSLTTDTYAYGYVPNGNVNINLPSSITITGQSMALALDLQVSDSASFPNTCYFSAGIPTYSITPTFNLTAATIASQPTNSANGQVTQLDAQISAINASANSLTLTVPQPNAENTSTLTVSTNASTVYQGINNSSAFAVGMFLDMDGAVQSDGSLLASRIAVLDPSAIDVLIGPVLRMQSGEPAANIPSAIFFNRLSEGQDPIPVSWAYGIGSAQFQISQQLTNLSSLPFLPVFNASNMVAGQYVYVTSPTQITSGGIYTAATTITLVPQIMDGTVIASTPSSNSFTDYTVALASYDLFPTLAVQPGQTTLLNDPNTVEVYVDNNTQLVNTPAPATGSTLRFYGLVFNDNGTLRMDCAQVTEGIAFSAPGTSSERASAGDTTITRRFGMGSIEQISTMTTDTPPSLK
jgi:Domain of unknown function (DUF5666)